MKRQWKTAFLTILDYRTMDSVDVIESLAGSATRASSGPWTPILTRTSRSRNSAPWVDRTHDAGMDVSQLMAHEDLISLDQEARKRLIDRIVRTIDAAGKCGVPAVSVLTGPAIWEPTAV